MKSLFKLVVGLGLVVSPVIFHALYAAGPEAQPPLIQAPVHQKPADLLGGIQRAVCYSGFRHGQHPDRGSGAVNPSDRDVLDDLQILSRRGFHLIRLYDAQDNALTTLRVIESNKLDMKVMVGAWLYAEVSYTNCAWHREPYPKATLEANKVKNLAEIDRAIQMANRYSNIVVAVSLGNEALVEWNDHLVTVEAMTGYVRKVKAAVRQPVTVADNCHWWAERGATLAGEVDFVSVHTYPVWEGRDIDDALAASMANLQEVRNALPRSRLVITEAGWATAANEFGQRASEMKQKRYYRDLFDWTGRMNITTFFFEAFDEEWKGDPSSQLGAEKHWGLFTAERKPKLAVRTPEPDGK